MLSNISGKQFPKKKEKKILSQKMNSRNNNIRINIQKSMNSSKRNNKKRINLLGHATQEFIFQLEKRKKLNSLKERSNKVYKYMNNLGQSFKSFTSNLNSQSNPLMMANLTNISFRRSILIRNRLRNLEKMNKQFDRDYNVYNFTLNLKKENQNRIEEIDEESDKRRKRDMKLRKDNFKVESMKIFNILYKKNKEGISFSDYKKNKKLKELKTSIDYICGTESKRQKGKNQNNINTISHYNDVIRSPSFIREKSKNASFTPSVKYNKTNVFYSKKYELVQELMDKDKKFIEKKNKTLQISPQNKIKYRIKAKNLKFLLSQSNKNNNHKKNKLLELPIKITDPNEIHLPKEIHSPKKHYSENKVNRLLGISQKENDKEDIISIRHKVTFSPIQRHPKLETEKNLFKIYNTINQEKKIRIKTAYNISGRTKNDTNTNESISFSKSSRNKIYPLIKNLLDNNYKLKDDLKFGFNIITNMINDFKMKKKMKIIKNELNIDKLRKDLKLFNVGSFVDEVDVVMNNVNKMEKIMRKKDINMLRKVAKSVIREDKLANKNLIYENNPLHVKIKKISDRRNLIKTKDKDEKNKDEEKENMVIEERAEMIKLFKNDGPDFNNEEYLSNLIKRYKSLKVK